MWLVKMSFTGLIIVSVMPINKDCRDGEILLYDGSTLSTNHSNGTVLVCLDNEYGTVCDDWWDPLDATVVCTQLGFSTTGLFSSVYHLCISPSIPHLSLSQALCQWSVLVWAVLLTGLSSWTMWCVLEERETSQSVATPPSLTVTDLRKLELDVKVYWLGLYTRKSTLMIPLHSNMQRRRYQAGNWKLYRILYNHARL